MVIGHHIHGGGDNVVVFLHEWMGDSRNWDAVLPYLPAGQNRYVFVDLRGYGQSKSIDGEFTVDEAVSDVAATITRLAPSQYALVAHSMSSLIALGLARLHGDRVRRLVLVSPVPATGFKLDDAAFGNLIKVATDDSAARDAIAARTGNRYGSGWIDAKLKRARASATPAAMKGYARMFTGTDLSETVRHLPVPILAICGRYDIPIYRLDSVNAHLSGLCRNVASVECLEAGHYGMLEAPVFIASHLERFVCLK